MRDIGINVAGLMTSDMIRRRVPEKPEADRIVVPGRCRGDLDALAAHYGIPVERGPDELKDLPLFFGRSGKAADLSRHDVKIFACLLYTSPSPRDRTRSRMPSSA